MNGWLTTYSEPEDFVIEEESLPIVILGFVEAGIVYRAAVRGDAVSSIELHPYGRRYNQWNTASERRFTVIESDNRGSV